MLKIWDISVFQVIAVVDFLKVYDMVPTILSS